VVGEAADGNQAVALAERLRPDVILMDVEMPGMDGLEATRRVTAQDGPSVLILTTFDRDDYLFAALQAGASGFLLKNGTPEALTEAVRVLAAGDALLAPAITRRVIETFANPALRQPGAGASGFLLKDVTPEYLVAAVRLVRAGDALLAPAITRRLVERFAGAAGPVVGAGEVHRDLAALTPRELEVLRLLAGGVSNAELAAAVGVSEATVKTHVARVLAKLGLRDRAQAVVAAYESGLVTPGSARTG
jgi:DNA-binding NarL/FixJ family response regulator